MLERAWGGAFRRGRGLTPRVAAGRKPSGAGRRPAVEGLEARQLLVASIGSIADVSVLSSLGLQVPVDGSASGSTTQTFTVTSSNPDVKATVAAGPFLTFLLSHAASTTPGDVSFANQPVTAQLFSDYTPNTTRLFQSFVNGAGGDYYVGKQITRISSDFSGRNDATDYVIQGGAPNPDGTGSSGLPGTPYGVELNQRVAFTNAGIFGVAHSSAPISNDTQFFLTTGPQYGLNYTFTAFAQLVAGTPTVANLLRVSTKANPNLGDKSTPVTAVTITSATLSNANPNGVVHIDATGAVPGETSTVVVTATDPTTRTTASQRFLVTVAPDTTNVVAGGSTRTGHPAGFTFMPLTYPVTQAVTRNSPATVQFRATNNNPNNTAVTTSFAVVTPPAHGTLSAVNAATNTVTYTPTTGYTGADSFTYRSTNTGGTPSPLVGNTAAVALNVTTTPPPPPPRASVNTGAVRQVGNVLVVDPPPRAKGTTDVITVSQTTDPAGAAQDHIRVTVNGATDTFDPLATVLNRIVVFGTKANTQVTVDPSVSRAIAVTLDGGHGGANVLQAGAGPTRLHGWFGQNVLIGGAGANEMVGLAGHVRFRPTATTDEIFAGRPHPGYSHYHAYHGKASVTLTPPGGTFYRDVNGKAVPIARPHRTRFFTNLYPGATQPGTTSTLNNGTFTSATNGTGTGSGSTGTGTGTGTGTNGTGTGAGSGGNGTGTTTIGNNGSGSTGAGPGTGTGGTGSSTAV